MMTTTTATTTNATTTATIAAIESIPWPRSDPADASTTTDTSTTVCSSGWRVGRSCHNARWLFLRLAHTGV